MLTRPRLRTMEAMGLLVVSQLLVRIVPFRLLARLCGSAGPAPSAGEPLGEPTDHAAMVVRRALSRGAQRLPWSTTCLVRAVAGQAMLKRRGTESTLMLGVAVDAGTFSAHAWLLSGGGVVCGDSEASGFAPIAALRGGSN